MGGAAPAAALSSFTTALDHRLVRITATPPAPLSVLVRLGVRLLAVSIVGVPTALLLMP
jgi:hypothetical protein